MVRSTFAEVYFEITPTLSRSGVQRRSPDVADAGFDAQFAVSYYSCVFWGAGCPAPPVTSAGLRTNSFGKFLVARPYSAPAKHFEPEPESDAPLPLLLAHLRAQAHKTSSAHKNRGFAAHKCDPTVPSVYIPLPSSI